MSDSYKPSVPCNLGEHGLRLLEHGAAHTVTTVPIPEPHQLRILGCHAAYLTVLIALSFVTKLLLSALSMLLSGMAIDHAAPPLTTPFMAPAFSTCCFCVTICIVHLWRTRAVVNSICGQHILSYLCAVQCYMMSRDNCPI